jgi:hypothetical protein
MQQPPELTLAQIEQVIGEIEMQMTVRIAQIEQLGAELSAAQTIMGTLKALLVEWHEQRIAIINRTFR